MQVKLAILSSDIVSAWEIKELISHFRIFRKTATSA